MRLATKLALHNTLFQGIHHIFHNNMIEEEKRRKKMWQNKKENK